MKISFLNANNNADSIRLEKASEELKLSFKLIKEAHYDSALFIINKARDTFKKLESWEKYIFSFRYEAFCYIQNDKQEAVLQTYKEAIKLAKLKLNKNNSLIPILYRKLGLRYYNLAQYERAIYYLKHAVNSFEELEHKNDFDDYFFAYSNISAAYLANNDFVNALAFLEKTNLLRIEKKIGGYSEALYYDKKAKIFFSLEKYNESKENCLKALSIFLSINRVYGILDSYFYLAQIERLEKCFNKGIIYVEKGISFAKENLEVRNSDRKLASLLLEYGNIYRDQNNNKQANNYYFEALKAHPDKNYHWIRRHIGDCYQKLEMYDSALMHYQQGIINVTINFNEKAIEANPKIENIKDNSRLLLLIKKKASVLFKSYNSQKLLNKSHLLASYKTSLFTIDLIENQLNYYSSTGSKLEWTKFIHECYEQTIQTCLALNKATGEEKYRLQAFEIAEKSKAGVLMADMKSLDAKHFGGIPDSLLNQERDIRISLSYNKTRLQNELAKKEKQDTLKVNEAKEKIFALNREREALEELFEKNYSKYHGLKYNNSQPSIQQIQNSLDEQTTLIEYFVGDSTTYAFTISKNDYQIKELPLIDSLGSVVQSLPNLLKKKDKEGYSSTALTLYQKLFEPLNITSGVPDHTNLIIIPDGALWQLNFDLLISQKPEKPEKQDYRKYQYLIKDYTISYAYSAKLLNQSVGQAVKTASKNEVLAFSYNNPDDISVGSYIAMRGFRNANLGDLPGTRKEIKAVSSVVEGAYYYGSFANEKNFKENAKDYKILHLALHGVIDNEDPMKSRLYFTQDKDTLEDNYLHAYELYNLELNADLAVLSACQTGSGKLIKGEGVMSLGRAFTYAGCRSLLLSQWDVSDAFTPGLMKGFYQNLKEGKTKSAALREAKLAYLAKADNLTSNPYYWAPLVQLGDNKPLKQDSYLAWIIGVSSLIVALAVFVYLRRRKN